VGTLSKLRQYDEALQKVHAIRILELGCGERHTAVVLETGNVFVWGYTYIHITYAYAYTVRALHDLPAAASCLLLTAHCSLLTAHYSLLTAHCSLLTAHYSLLTTHCLLLTRWNDKGQLGTQLEGQLGSQGTHTPSMLKAPSELRFTPLSGLCCGPCSTSVWS
jgi:alpha-tubulin suppressor-like RCC1 family protein